MSRVCWNYSDLTEEVMVSFRGSLMASNIAMMIYKMVKMLVESRWSFSRVTHCGELSRIKVSTRKSFTIYSLGTHDIDGCHTATHCMRHI